MEQGKVHSFQKILRVFAVVFLLLLFSSISSGVANASRLLIITPEEFSDPLFDLASFKNSNSMPTTIWTLEDVYSYYDQHGPDEPADEPAKIKWYIAHFKDTISPDDLLCVMLVGDCNKFPVRWQFGHLYDRSGRDKYGLHRNPYRLYVPSDFYYADLYRYDEELGVVFNDWDYDDNGRYGEIYLDRLNPDRIDPHPDVAVARVPAADITQVEDYVAKVIRYEYNADDDLWFKRLLLIQKEFCEHISTKESVSLYLSPLGFETTRLYSDDIHPCLLGFYQYRKPYPPIDDRPSPYMISEELNRGVGFVSETAHGVIHPGIPNPESPCVNPPELYTDWGIFKIDDDTTNDLKGLSPYHGLPVIYSGACDSANFCLRPPFGTTYTTLDGSTQCPVLNQTEPPRPDEDRIYPIPSPIQEENFHSIGEAFLMEPAKGAIAYFGNQYTGEGMHRLLDKTFFQLYSSGTHILGLMWIGALNIFAAEYLDPVVLEQNWKPMCKMHTPSRVILFGDPSLRVGGLDNISDFTAPETTIRGVDPGAPTPIFGWSEHERRAIIPLDVVDRGLPPSGVRRTFYRLTSPWGDWQRGQRVIIYVASSDQPFLHTFRCYSEDWAGNREIERSYMIWVDPTKPTTEVRLSGAQPATKAWRLFGGIHIEAPSYNGKVTVTLEADDDYGVADIYYRLDGTCPEDGCVYTDAFDVVGVGLHVLEYWSKDNVGNEELPHNIIWFRINPYEALPIILEIERLRELLPLRDTARFRVREEAVSAMPPIAEVKYEYADQSQPGAFSLIGVDLNGDDGWGCDWDTTQVPDGEYYVRLTVTGLEGYVIHQEQLSTKLCNIPSSSYDFTLYAPDQIERGQFIPYKLQFANHMGYTLNNLTITCSVDTSFFDDMVLLGGGYLDQQGRPSWFKSQLGSGETWSVRFKGLTRPDIHPAALITSQGVITADTVPLLLSNDSTTPEEEDYTAVTVSLINGSIRGKVRDNDYGTPISASVTIDGPVSQTEATGDQGQYSFSDLPPGDYSVSVDAEGYDYLSPTGPLTATVDGTGKTVQLVFFLTHPDTRLPYSIISHPADEIVQQNLTEIHGTASDYVSGSGINKVELSIRCSNTDTYWDGGSWVPSETWLLASGTTDWTYHCSGIGWNSSLSYALKSRATDNEGNVERSIPITTTPPVPMLVSPPNGTETVMPKPTFDWSDVPDCAYRIQVNDDTGSLAPEIHEPYLYPLTTSHYTPTVDLPAGTYHWCVKAISSAAESDWSEVRTVTVTPHQVVITDAYATDRSMLEHIHFSPGDTIFYHIIYSLYGKPGKLYKAKGIVKAFGQTLVEKQHVNQGAGYHIIIEDEVPQNAEGAYTIKYILKMVKNGVLLDKEKIKSQIYVVE